MQCATTGEDLRFGSPGFGSTQHQLNDWPVLVAREQVHVVARREHAVPLRRDHLTAADDVVPSLTSANRLPAVTESRGVRRV
jgi:hypothetical protein